MNLILITIFLGNLQVTSYRSVPSQTDDSPFYTSIGERVNPHGVAVSQDLLKRWGGPLNYGDTVYIEEIGFKKINDVMNPRHKNSVDIWVSSLSKEKEFHSKFKGKKLNVWIVRESNETE